MEDGRSEKDSGCMVMTIVVAKSKTFSTDLYSLKPEHEVIWALIKCVDNRGHDLFILSSAYDIELDDYRVRLCCSRCKKTRNMRFHSLDLL